MNFLHRILRLAIFPVFVMVLYGCAAPTALTSKTSKLDLSQKSIVLATIEITRESNRSMPWPTRLQVMSTGATGSREIQAFAVDSEGMEYGEDGRNYVSLVRLSLAPGKFHLAGLMGQISAFPFRGLFQAPLGLMFEVPSQSIIYLGRVKIHMRPRKDNEFRAGSLIPLIDQAVLGISTSTFDISTEDASAVDLTLFKEAFPVLRDAEVKVLSLPPFDREPIDRTFIGGDVYKPAPTEAESASKSN
jgi:hypothetical protein